VHDVVVLKVLCGSQSFQLPSPNFPEAGKGRKILFLHLGSKPSTSKSSSSNGETHKEGRNQSVDTLMLGLPFKREEKLEPG
jgi:hypothetical protein